MIAFIIKPKKDIMNPRVNIEFCCMKAFKNICSDNIPQLRIGKPGIAEDRPSSWADYLSLRNNTSVIVNSDIIKYQFCPFCGALVTCEMIEED